MILDKGRPLTKEFCEICKKEIKPGEPMLLKAVVPSRASSLSSRLWSPNYYGYYDNSPKYHEECYIRNTKKKK